MNSVLSPPGVWFVNNRKMANWNDTSRARIAHVQTQLRPLLCQGVPDSCRHLRGRGHVKGAVRSLHHAVNHARYVARFDIKSYYQSMHHDVLLSLLDSAGAHAYCQAVVADYLSLPDRRNTGRGMVAGGSLLPGLGALFSAPRPGDGQASARGHSGLLCALHGRLRHLNQDPVAIAPSHCRHARSAGIASIMRPPHQAIHW